MGLGAGNNPPPLAWPVDSHRFSALPPSFVIGFRRSEDPIGPRMLTYPPHTHPHTAQTMAQIEFPFADPSCSPPTPPSHVCDWLLQPSRANNPLPPCSTHLGSQCVLKAKFHFPLPHCYDPWTYRAPIFISLMPSFLINSSWFLSF